MQMLLVSSATSIPAWWVVAVPPSAAAIQAAWKNNRSGSSRYPQPDYRI
jgi:hypothetical protein